MIWTLWKGAFSQSKNDTILGAVADAPDSCAVIPWDLNRLESWTVRNFMKFNKWKCKYCIWRKIAFWQQYTLRANKPESSSVKKDLSILVDTKLNICQWTSASVAKAVNNILGCIRQSTTSRSREMILLLYLALVRPCLECCGQSWAPQFKTEINLLERVQCRATRMTDILEYLVFGEAEKAGTVSLKKTQR